MHLRRSAIRLYFSTARALGLCDRDPSLDVALPPRSPMVVRALTDDEVVLCRNSSLHSLRATRWTAAWALAESNARTSEIPQVRVSDVDLNGDRVWLHGSNQAEARWGHPTPWGLTQLKRRIGVLSNDEKSNPLLVYRGRGSAHSSQVASCIAIKEVLTSAGLGHEPDVRPRLRRRVGWPENLRGFGLHRRSRSQRSTPEGGPAARPAAPPAHRSGDRKTLLS